MWVTDRIGSDAPLPELAGTAATGDLDLIQVREPGLDRLPLELLVRAILTVSSPSSAIVINSDIELARKLGVGVHLPEAGPGLEEARELLGSNAIVGRSVHSIEAARASGGATYLIAGHVFETSSKAGKEPLGLERFAKIAAVAPAPVLAIGGISPELVQPLLDVGAAGVAILSPLTRVDSIRDRVRDYRSELGRPVNEDIDIQIKATVNGKEAVLPPGTTVADFLAGRELHERLVVVERNGEIIKRSTFPEVVIEEGDLLEIVHFVGGG
jgi:thiamine biosynthesis protein ThiS